MRLRNPVPLLIEPLHQRKEEQPAERPAAENPDDQQQPKGVKTHKTIDFFKKEETTRPPRVRAAGGQHGQIRGGPRAPEGRRRLVAGGARAGRTFLLRDYPLVQIALFKKRLHIMFKAPF